MMSNFQTDDRGAITFFVLILSIGLMAMMGLVMDVGRSSAAHTQMQAYVDNVALAMARELDKAGPEYDDAGNLVKDGAINRALEVLAATKLDHPDPILRKDSSLIRADGETNIRVDDATGSFEVLDSQVYFLTDQPTVTSSTLRPEDYQSLVTTSDADASHVLVFAAQREVPFTFFNVSRLMSNMGASRGAGASAEDYARSEFGFGAWASAENYDLGFNLGGAGGNPTLMIALEGEKGRNLTYRQQIQADKSRDGEWGDGTYGLIDTLADDGAGTCANTLPAGASAEDVLACRLALDTAGGRFYGNTVSAVSDVTDANGQDTLPVSAGMNVRFGIYDPVVSGLQTSAEASPDVNTITGELYTCSGPDYDTVTESTPLPVSTCFADGSCTGVSEAVTADQITQYCEINHGSSNCPKLPDGSAPASGYEIYLAEIFRNKLDPVGPETINTCNTNATAQAGRRVVTVAIVDEADLTDGDTSPSNVPVIGFAEAFLTRPLDMSDYYVADFESFTRSNGTTASLNEGDIVNNNSAKFDGSGYGTMRNPYASLGMRIDVIQSHNGRGYDDNAPMIFDTTNPGTGSNGDPDLGHTGLGNVLIISERDDSARPDDEAKGGTLVFHFSQPTYVHSIVVFDTEEGGTVRAFMDNPSTNAIERPKLSGGCGADNREDLMEEGTIPEWATTWWDCMTLALHALGENAIVGPWDDLSGLKEKPDANGSLRKRALAEGEVITVAYDGTTTGTDRWDRMFYNDPNDDNPHDNWLDGIGQWAKGVPHLQDNDMVRVLIEQDNVTTLTYTMHGDSGAMDELVFWNEQTEYLQRGQVTLEFLRYINRGDSRVVTATQLSN